jgi:mono/diheme cytochrome c family protein
MPSPAFPRFTPRVAWMVAPIVALGAATFGAITFEFQPRAFAQSLAPTYYRDVQPILEQHCVSCHVAGGIAPFKLDSGQDAVARAVDIARVVESGSMPPWPPGVESPPFLNERKLGAASKKIIVDWAKAGAPLGKPAAGQKP